MQNIHFIGIGGIGLSALARFLRERGHVISGSDLKESKITRELENEGVSVSIPHHKDNVLGKDLIIYSAAIGEENPEFKAARSLNIPCLSRKEALPLILEGKQVFAVAGAHGKSTTSSILASLLKDSSVIIGAILKEFDSNMIYKESPRLVFEADESDSSFLNSNPFLAIVTNVEAEHLEHYEGELGRLQYAYKTFLNAAQIRIINAEDDFLQGYAGKALRLYPSRDIKNVKMQLEDFRPRMSFEFKNLGTFSIAGMGYHLAVDAALAIIAAVEFESVDKVREHLKSYQGIKKRFDILHADEKLAIIDDYGHHPTEIRATLEAARAYADLAGFSHITALFQPHRYTRLAANLKAFAEAFALADRLIILPVYAAGEAEIELDLEASFAGAKFIKDLRREGKFLVTDRGEVLDSGLIIGFGAGDISQKLRL